MSVKQASLTDVISEVVEELTMMMVEKAESFEDFHPSLCGFIEFKGIVSGRLTVECTSDFSNSLAGNLLGLDESEVTEGHGWDAVGELLNIICGNLVTKMFDDTTPFRLSAPQIDMVEESPEGESSPEDDAEEVNLVIDDFPVRFGLIMS